jgi:quercetin dioxygenase-like cupin family protein
MSSNKHVTNIAEAEGAVVAPGLSTSFGAAVTGEKMHIGYIHKARGTGSKPHIHKNEQFNYVMQGALMGEIAGEPFHAPQGHVIHIPANTVHTIIADPEDNKDVIFIVCKDTTAGVGEADAADGKRDGARYEDGFAPKK